MLAENSFCVIITGDFNCRSTQWWEDDIENNEGKLLEPMKSDIGLHQLIAEPTLFQFLQLVYYLTGVLKTRQYRIPPFLFANHTFAAGFP